MNEYTITQPRSWRERLFSLPWRPHHNVQVTRLYGTAITRFDAHDGNAQLSLRPQRIAVTTERQP